MTACADQLISGSGLVDAMCVKWAFPLISSKFLACASCFFPSPNKMLLSLCAKTEHCVPPRVPHPLIKIALTLNWCSSLLLWGPNERTYLHNNDKSHFGSQNVPELHCVWIFFLMVRWIAIVPVPVEYKHAKVKGHIETQTGWQALWHLHSSTAVT